MPFKSDKQRKAVMAKLNQGSVRSDVNPTIKDITGRKLKIRIKKIQNEKDKEIDRIMHGSIYYQERILRSRRTEMEEEYLERLERHLDRKSLKELKRL